jgi:thiosulfate dehydrogenase (quinone) large subunit
VEIIDLKSMNNSNEAKSADGPETTGNCCGDYSLAFLLLRGWLAVRAVLAGLEKFGAYKTIQQPFIDPATGEADPNAVVEIKVKFYSFANYNGIPAALQGKFAHEPLLPHFALTAFNFLLGPALIITGLMLLVGLGTRISLFVQGLIYIALTAGLVLIGQNDGPPYLGIHLGLVAFALMLAKHNKLALLKKW